MRLRTAQGLRLIDALLAGPLMVWGGSKLVSDNPAAGGLLMFLGVETAVSSSYSYLHHRGGLIPGGKAEGRYDTRVDPRQLRLGIEVEREHTDDTDLAREIALDHLIGEDPRYYSKLKRAGL